MSWTTIGTIGTKQGTIVYNLIDKEPYGKDKCFIVYISYLLGKIMIQ